MYLVRTAKWPNKTLHPTVYSPLVPRSFAAGELTRWATHIYNLMHMEDTFEATLKAIKTLKA